MLLIATIGFMRMISSILNAGHVIESTLKMISLTGSCKKSIDSVGKISLASRAMGSSDLMEFQGGQGKARRKARRTRER